MKSLLLRPRALVVTALLASFVVIVPGCLAGSVPRFSKGTVRTYYIAAEDVSWDYAPSGNDLVDGTPIPAPWTNRTIWSKSRYIEYTDATFSKRKQQPEWLGILGPVIRATVGDTILVHFLNRSQNSHGIHPHGLRYDKDNEGARYVRSGLGAEIPPGGRFTYRWLADAGSGPGPGDPSSVVWWYHPHVEPGRETNSGLLGPIIVTAADKARPDSTPKDVDREFVTMFMIFDEQQGKNEGLFHTINGYIFGNLPGLVMKQGEKVRWYLLGMGNEKDLHTPHWHGKTVTYARRHTDVIELLPASMTSADMVADNAGNWLFHCHVSDHMEAGMMATFTIIAPSIRSCPLKVGPAEFWQPSSPSLVELTNTTGKTIRRLALHAGYFANTAQNLNGIPYEWLLMEQIKPHAKRSLDLTDNQFQAGGLTGLYADHSAIGLIVYPGRIEYTDGSIWIPHVPAECFNVYWRDPKNHPQLPVLPPFQLDELEREDLD
jgi:hypothetical protein